MTFNGLPIVTASVCQGQVPSTKQSRSSVYVLYFYAAVSHNCKIHSVAFLSFRVGYNITDSEGFPIDQAKLVLLHHSSHFHLADSITLYSFFNPLQYLLLQSSSLFKSICLSVYPSLCLPACLPAQLSTPLPQIINFLSIEKFSVLLSILLPVPTPTTGTLQIVIK